MQKSVSLFLLIGLTSLSSFGANRFLNLPVIRCTPSENGLPEKMCNSERSERLSRQHINREEYAFLAQKGAIPSFTIDNQPYGYCYCGCFAPWTRISVSSNGTESLMQIGEILPPFENLELVTLDKGSTLAKLTKRTSKIEASISGPEELPLVIATTRAGVEIGLTTQHPVLISTGNLVAAKDLIPGQSLVDNFGVADEIIDISHRTIPENVINVLVSGENLVQHLIFAENRIVGDIFVQNAAQSEIDAVRLRE